MGGGVASTGQRSNMFFSVRAGAGVLLTNSCPICAGTCWPCKMPVLPSVLSPHSLENSLRHSVLTLLVCVNSLADLGAIALPRYVHRGQHAVYLASLISACTPRIISLH